MYKELSPEDRKAKRLEEETPIWDEFWSWIDTLDPSGGSKLEKAVKYALNHKESLMNYLLDGRCEISNNSAERKAKVYATGRKNFLFHDSVDGAKATAIVMSLVETAKANNLNVYKYLYTLLLYMPDYKNEPAGIEEPLPWSTFVQDKCSGIIDDSLIDEKAREIGTYTYELDSYSNASRVFWSTQRRSLYKQLILEQEAVKELLIHLYKDHGDSGVLKLFNEMHSLEFDDALINDYLADLCGGNVNDSLIDWIDDLHEEIEDNDKRKERHELLSLIGNVSVLFDDWDDADF